jgi:hypothetical protein
MCQDLHAGKILNLFKKWFGDNQNDLCSVLSLFYDSPARLGAIAFPLPDF